MSAFPVPSVTARVVVLTSYLAISVLSLILNGLVIYLWQRFVTLKKKPSNLFVVSLSMSGLLMMSKVPIFLLNLYYGGPVAGVLGAQVYGLVSLVSGMAAIWSIMILSMERAWVVYRVTRAQLSVMRMNTVRSVVTVQWVVAVAVSLPPLFGYNRYVYEGYLYSSTVDVDSISPADRMYIWTLLTMGYIVPTVLISLSHLTIIGLYRYNNFEVERRLWRGSLLLLLVWIVSWTPYAGVFLAFVTNNSHLVTQHSDMVPAILCKMSSALNPLVYGLMLPGFKKCLRKLFRHKNQRLQMERLGIDRETTLRQAREAKTRTNSSYRHGYT